MSSNEDLIKVVNRVVCDVLNSPDVVLTEETTAADVPGWDSLTYVQIIIEIERLYSLRFTSTEVAQLENAGSLVELIEKHRNKS